MVNTLKSVVNTLTDILKIKEIPNFGPMPSPIVVNSRFRNGMSALRVTNLVLAKKRELGVPTGTLEDGTANIDDILWYTALQGILKEISLHSKITVGTLPGQQVIASGVDASGDPVVVYGTTTTYGIGGATIE